MVRFVSLLSLSILLISCKSTPELKPTTVEIVKYVKLECGNPPQVEPFKALPVEWEVIDGKFTLTAQGYENLSKNTAGILKGVKQIKLQRDFYENCITNSRAD